MVAVRHAAGCPLLDPPGVPPRRGSGASEPEAHLQGEHDRPGTKPPPSDRLEPPARASSHAISGRARRRPPAEERSPARPAGRAGSLARSGPRTEPNRVDQDLKEQRSRPWPGTPPRRRPPAAGGRRRHRRTCGEGSSRLVPYDVLGATEHHEAVGATKFQTRPTPIAHGLGTQHHAQLDRHRCTRPRARRPPPRMTRGCTSQRPIAEVQEERATVRRHGAATTGTSNDRWATKPNIMPAEVERKFARARAARRAKQAEDPQVDRGVGHADQGEAPGPGAEEARRGADPGASRHAC